MAKGLSRADQRGLNRLARILGKEVFRQFSQSGNLYIRSQVCAGRTYRLNRRAVLHFCDIGDRSFHYNRWLCIHPTAVPSIYDAIADIYLLLTTDEDKLLAIANPREANFDLIESGLPAKIKAEAIARLAQRDENGSTTAANSAMPILPRETGGFSRWVISVESEYTYC